MSCDVSCDGLMPSFLLLLLLLLLNVVHLKAGIHRVAIRLEAHAATFGALDHRFGDAVSGGVCGEAHQKNHGVVLSTDGVLS